MFGKARATISPGEPLSPRAVAESWVLMKSNPDPNGDKILLTVGDSSDMPAVVSINEELYGESIGFNLATHILGDPQFAGADGEVLAFDCSGDAGPDGLQVSVVRNEFTPLVQTYVATVSLQELSANWNSIVLPRERFHAADAANALEHWSDFDKLLLQGTTTKAHPFRVANLRWVKATPQP
jgi:hypothetical protein